MEDYYAYHHRVVAKKRRRRAVIASLAVLALLCAGVGAFYFAGGQQGLAALFSSEPGEAAVGGPAGQPVPDAVPAGTALPAPTPTPAPAPPTAAPDAAPYVPQRLLPAVDAAVWDTAVPVPAPDTMDTGYYNTDFRMAAVPANGTVDDSYFNTVTFAGDSIASGLGLASYKALPNAHYAAYKSAGASSFVYNTTMENAVTGTKETPMETILASQPDYVYVHIGTNDLVNPTGEENFIALYERLIDMLHEQLPGVVIYIQSIPGVQEEVVQTRPGLYAERIMTVNNMVANLALRKGCYFINTQEALAYADGSAIDEYSASDGIHFNPTGYHAWADYLRTHTVWDRRSVYVGQNPYYIYGR